jgi:hypothetical protein
VRLVLDAERGGGFTVHGEGGGGGYVWTPDPERALGDMRERLLRFVAADLRLRQKGAPRHIAVLAGECPTCGMPATDCVGVEL